MLDDAEKFKEEDQKVKERIESKNALENYIYTIKNSMDDEKLKDKFSDEDKTKLEQITTSAMEWLDNNTTAEKDEYEAKQKEIQDECMPIMTKLHTGDMPDMSNMPDMKQETGPTVEEVD